MELSLAARSSDVYYLTVSESVGGNLKDILIFAIVSDLRRCVVHLHGGSLARDVFLRSGLLRMINMALYSRIGAVIVTGESHRSIFCGMVKRHRIHVVANSAESQFFVTDAAIEKKHQRGVPLRILYISTMSDDKGCTILVESYFALQPAEREGIRIDFAGRFNAEEDKARFCERISADSHLEYHGMVAGEKKRSLLDAAHVVCLPSKLAEGQPLCILEGYAAGCAVIATGTPGVRDVVKHGVNGFLLQSATAADLGKAIRFALSDAGEIRVMGLRNAAVARAFHTQTRFTMGCEQVMERVAEMQNTIV